MLLCHFKWTTRTFKYIRIAARYHVNRTWIFGLSCVICYHLSDKAFDRAVIHKLYLSDEFFIFFFPVESFVCFSILCIMYLALFCYLRNQGQLFSSDLEFYCFSKTKFPSIFLLFLIRDWSQLALWNSVIAPSNGCSGFVSVSLCFHSLNKPIHYVSHFWIFFLPCILSADQMF